MAAEKTRRATTTVLAAFVPLPLATLAACTDDASEGGDGSSSTPQAVRSATVDALFAASGAIAEASSGQIEFASGRYFKCGENPSRLEYGASALIIGIAGTPGERIDLARRALEVDGWVVSAAGDDDGQSGEPWINVNLGAYDLGVRYDPDPLRSAAEDGVVLSIVGDCVPVDDETFSDLISSGDSELTAP